MMYLSHTNDCPNKQGEERLLAVVLNDDVLSNIKSIRDICNNLSFPYRARYLFDFPNDNVRLLERDFLDDFVEDCKEYQSWEIGGEDPLDYYRYQMHPYKPKEDFWHSIKPQSVELAHFQDNSFGFNAYVKNEIYNGYAFRWDLLK